MKSIKLTYITSTMNKLPYLRISLENLLKNKGDDEEIIVADGGSNDGTKEYLEQLFKENKIEYFVSEKDKGESHALNKLFIKARGELITLITDDDAFNYPNIRVCKKFMLENCEIDLLGTDGGKKNQDLARPVEKLAYLANYKNWQKNHKPFSFCGLGIMVRKSAIPLLGFWDPNFSRADAEFTLRVTSGKANIAWYSNPSFVNISNPHSVSVTKMEKIYLETQRLEQFYLGKKFIYPIWFVKLRAKISRTIRGDKKNTIITPLTFSNWKEILGGAEKWLEKENTEAGNFHSNK